MNNACPGTSSSNPGIKAAVSVLPIVLGLVAALVSLF